MAQLIQALRYEPKIRGFDSRRDYWDFSLTELFQPHYGPGIISASNRYECQECLLWEKGWCVGLTLPPPFADCLEIMRASIFWSPKGLSRPLMG